MNWFMVGFLFTLIVVVCLGVLAYRKIRTPKNTIPQKTQPAGDVSATPTANAITTTTPTATRRTEVERVLLYFAPLALVLVVGMVIVKSFGNFDGFPNEY